jgi:hypothetical protein
VEQACPSPVQREMRLHVQRLNRLKECWPLATVGRRKGGTPRVHVGAQPFPESCAIPYPSPVDVVALLFLYTSRSSQHITLVSTLACTRTRHRVHSFTPRQHCPLSFFSNSLVFTITTTLSSRYPTHSLQLTRPAIIHTVTLLQTRLTCSYPA